MAIFQNIHGAMLVEVESPVTAGGTGFEALGFTPNDALPSFDDTTSSIAVLTSEKGDTPDDRIYSGKVIGITLSVIKFDRDVLNKLIAAPSSVARTIGEFGTPGLLMHGDGAVGSNAFRLRFTGTTAVANSPGVGAAAKRYTFRNCAMDGDAAHSDIGIAPELVTLSIQGLPDENGVLYVEEDYA